MRTCRFFVHERSLNTGWNRAKPGWPLLRACPNTNAFRRLGFLDTLSPDEQGALAGQLAEFEAGESAAPPATMEERIKRIAAFPLVKVYLEDIENAGACRGIGKVPVKVIAGVREDKTIGGIEGWAAQMGFRPDELVPPRPHAEGLADLVPASPRNLRRLIRTMMTRKFDARETKPSSEITTYTGVVSGIAFGVDVIFARSGGHSAHQFDYHLRFRTGEQAGSDRYRL